jgi:predicted DNA-binding helix-hairpin-helix protein
MSRLTVNGSRFSRVKCTTQFIVGASDETDSEIIEYMSGLYDRLNFKRVYFSAYQKGLGNPGIPGEMKPVSSNDETFIREHRLYQADYLIRKYGFKGNDIPIDESGNLRLDKDPKEIWAESHPEFYPVRINTSDKEALLRVPGLGPDTVNRILKMRSGGKINRIEDLGVKGKRLEKLKGYVVCE